ncbi:unnamed protein product [Acanthoscelides obtectus]|uniref:Uncharacterized protein n=1 Tax=Acanthoscelides obtectus TaxID=200917 RepID=A0A9P0LD73_ACAOB|nr:unnamed protein product [Acanthoscelides obtectus]CAH2012652.1 unnamed protein product [Acanthoscelides obtectus]CAK1622384.1 hypothetical protein AOBTE_LOCUS1458 [Acanthoscelides obtectus]CAK1622427.1 hypothetical protein AOBTE_LOCUS1472 [Acanthoscelides obtectus]
MIYWVDLATWFKSTNRRRASKIGNSAYFSYWYEYLPRSCTTKLVIMQSQKKAIVTAGGLIDINLATSLTTVKTMVSYCMFLRTMGAE